MKIKLISTSVVCLIVILLVSYWFSRKHENYTDFFSTCNLDAFFSPDFSTNLQSRRHWLRYKTKAERNAENGVLDTEMPDNEKSQTLELIRMLFFQFRLAGLQKLQQSKPSDFIITNKEDEKLKYSCTFTPQDEPLFSMSGRERCNVISNKGEVYNHPRLRQTNADNVAVRDTCYIKLPKTNNIDSDTRKAILKDVNEILEFVGMKVDATTMKKMDDLNYTIQQYRQQADQMQFVTLPNSQQQEKQKYQDYLAAEQEYKDVSYQMDSNNPSSVYNVYYSLLDKQ